MEDQNLIVAVCSRPVLYDTTMVSYRDRNKKERAWVDVAEDTGFPVDVCRRKWKSLRDRETSSNLPRGAEEVEEDGAPETSLSGAGEDEELEEAAAGPSHNTDQPSSESDPEDADAAPAPAPVPVPVPAAGPSCVPVPEAGPAPRPQSGTKRKRARVPEGNTNMQAAILQALQRQNAVPTPTPLSGNEHFVMGLVPSLERLPPEVLEYVKFQIRKVIYDTSNFTLNLEPV
ncbi:unnamed protein product [Arctogadus glacialis]